MRKTKIASNLEGSAKLQSAPRWLFQLNKGLRGIVNLDAVMQTHHKHRSQKRQVAWNFGVKSWIYKIVE